VNKLTKDQRTELEKKLNLPWGMAVLMCDGRRVTLQVQRFKGFKYRVMTFVDGIFKWAWTQEKSNAPESKFLRKSVRPNLTPAQRAKAEKAIGKRAVAKDPYYSGSFTVYLPDWATGKAALNHLCKVCESVEIVEGVDRLAERTELQID
jgi:hypothetical protein